MSATVSSATMNAQQPNLPKDRSESTAQRSGSRLPELRASVRVSDGASIRITETAEAVSLSIRRGSSMKKHRGGLETYITCLIEDLRMSLKELNVSVSSKTLEDWAILIHGCLSVDSRSFHSVHHVFEISGGCDAIQLVAACFRDCISYSADGKLNKKQEELVDGILDHSHGRGPRLTTDLDDDDLRLLMVLDIFGLTPGQVLATYSGLDVFLSAVLTTRVFANILSLPHLTQIVTCMEATIAFRPPVNGRTALERLHGRLTEVNEKFELNLQPEEIVKTIQRATDLSNRNLGNFASKDAAVFLDHTWSLLPERSVALRRSLLYTVNDMLLATRDMERMMTDIEADRIFQSFEGVPDDEELERFHMQTNNNLTMGCKYLRAKLLSICVISAFAVLTGGDAPMSFFCGDLPAGNQRSSRLGECFPVEPIEKIEERGCDRDVYQIMTAGRKREQVFDRRDDPLAAFFYATLGDEGVATALGKCSFPMRKVTALALLKHLPLDAVRLVGNEVGKIALTRMEGIQSILKELLDKKDSAAE